MAETSTWEQVLEFARRLPPAEQRRLVEAMQHDDATPRHPFPSLYGAWADLGPAPSEEDIAEARREMWRGCTSMDGEVDHG